MLWRVLKRVLRPALFPCWMKPAAFFSSYLLFFRSGERFLGFSISFISLTTCGGEDLGWE